MGSVAETAAFSRIQNPVPLLLTSHGVPTRAVSGIDLRDRRVSTHERRVEFSAVESRLLCHLAGEPTRVFTCEELLRDVWGYRTPSRTVDSHACRLRRKLASPDQRLVLNVFGVGYRLCDPAALRGSR